MSNTPLFKRMLEATALYGVQCSETKELAPTKKFADMFGELEELESALKELLRLKALKDSFGKTAEYLADQPLAWARAKTAIAPAREAMRKSKRQKLEASGWKFGSAKEFLKNSDE